MAFEELQKGLALPKGATERYRLLEALGRQLEGKLYSDIRHPFEVEAEPGRTHIPLRERRPSTIYNLPYEITQDTSAELFGDEQFPIVHAIVNREEDESATVELTTLMDVSSLQQAMVEAYEEGVIGSVAVVIHRDVNGLPYYDVLPGKFCQPIYGEYSSVLLGLIVTYPIKRKAVEDRWPHLLDDPKNKKSETFWYRYTVGPSEIVDYYPMPDDRYEHLGEKDEDGNTIVFVERDRRSHGFKGRLPAVFQRNFGGRGRSFDGMALWWPIVDMCVEIDYTLAQVGRGLRYSADPTLFVKRGDLDLSTGLYDKPAGGMSSLNMNGVMVRGVTNTLVGEGKDSDAKLLEINASGMKEEREFVADLREYALEVVGGMRARAQDKHGPTTGRAIDKTLKPLRRLVRRQRRPYGMGLLVPVLDLTVYGFEIGLFVSDQIDLTKIPDRIRYVPEWPAEDTLQGQDLYYHAEGLQLLAGGSNSAPKELLDPAAVGEKAAADIGFHKPFEAIKGSGKAPVLPGAGPGITTA